MMFLTITCENASNDTIVWMVIAERKDSFIKNGTALIIMDF